MSLWNELKRRNVLRVTAAYVVVGWLMLQVADIVFGFIGVPDWVGKLLITLLVLGFVPVIAVAWIFELTPEGVKRESDLPADHQNHVSARRLDYVTITAIVILAFITFYQQFQPPEPQAESKPAPPKAANTPTKTDAKPEQRPQRRPLPPELMLEPDPQSVAVLPFANRSADEDTRYFVDGVHDDLLTQLAKIGDLTVISRTSVMEYRDTTKNMKQIGEELGVAHILEGAVQKAGQRVRVNAQLIDADTDKHLWAESFDRELTANNLFDIQSDIARSIAHALASTLTDEELENMGVGDAPTDNQEAYDLYLQARAIGTELSGEAPRERIALLKQAVELDPDFALAVAEIGFQYTNWYWFQSKDPQHERLGHEWLERARAMDPDDPRIQWYWADHLYHGHLDYDAALAALAEAEKGLPNVADIIRMRGWVLRRVGDFEDSITAFERAVQLDPLDPETLFDLAYTNAARGNVAVWQRWRDRALERADPELRLTLLAVDALISGGNLEAIERLLDSHEGLGSDGLEWQFRAPFFGRDYEAAEAALADWPDDLVLTQWAAIPTALAAAMLAEARGNPDLARQAAEKALETLDTFLRQFPEDARAHAARARALAYAGRHEEALQEADLAVTLYPREVDALASKEFMLDRVLTIAQIAESVTVAAAVEELLETHGKPVGYAGLMLNPVFDRHRDSEAFKQLKAKYGTPAT